MTKPADMHYLEADLRERLCQDPEIFDFLDRYAMDGIWYWDLTQPEHEWMSATMWIAIGHDPAQRSHSPDEWQHLIDPEDLETAKASLAAHLEDPSSPYDVNARYRRADGGIATVRCRGVAIRDEDGVPIRMLGTHTDMTALVASEHELRQRAESLERYAYIVSHDLQEPLRTLHCWSEMAIEVAERALSGGDEVDREALQEELAQARRFCADASEACFGLVTSTLEYSRSGGQLTITDAAVGDIVGATMGALAASLTEADMAIRIEGTGYPIRCDVAAMTAALRNLVSNAVKFRAKLAPSVSIVATRASGILTIAVTDNGIGISPEHLPRVTEPSWRGHAKTDYPGTGLGLALVDRIVRAHGGTVEVQSELGVGTTVMMRLPC